MSATSKSIESLIECIDLGELVLPEIQRDFVWNRKNVLLLFDSLYRKLPIGYMLVWKAKKSVPGTSFSGRTTKFGQPLPSFYGYLLDGQQRLTAIRNVRDGDDNFPLMFSLWPDNESKPDEDRFCYLARWNRDDPWYVPVTDIISKQLKAYQVVENLKEFADEEELTPEVIDRIIASVTKLQARIMECPVGVIEYGDDHEEDSYRKATELFIRFNSTGKKLKGSDLVAAELALTVPELVSKGINKTSTRYSPAFSFSNTFLIQCLSAIHNSSMSMKKHKEVWKGTKQSDIRKSWQRTEKGLARTIEFLTGTLKWDSDSWLPSVNSLIPLIYLLSMKKFSIKERALARKWLLTANVYGIFSGSVHSELDRLLKGLKKEPTIEKLNHLTMRKTGKIKRSHFETKRKSGPMMSLYISMLRDRNAKDWLSRTSLDGKVVGHNAELQVHHIFPQAALFKEEYESDDINTFANYAIINKDTNIGISSEEPVSYLKKLKIRKKDLGAQCIPADKNLWSIDRYEDFLAKRRKLLAERINAFLKG